MFTEIFDKLEDYKTEHVNKLFDEYEKKVDALLESRRKLREERTGILMRGLIFKEKMCRRE